MSDLHHEEIVDGKWLLSYADLMTMLFGLFVLLFSVSMENQTTYQESLKKLSDSTTGNSVIINEQISSQNRNWEKEFIAEKTKREDAELKLSLIKDELFAKNEKLKAAADLERQIEELKKLLANLSRPKNTSSLKIVDISQILIEKEKMASEIRRLEDELRRLKKIELKVSTLEEDVRKTRALEAKLTLLEDELRKSKTVEQPLASNKSNGKKIEYSDAIKEIQPTEREISSLQIRELPSKALFEKQEEEIRSLSKLLEQSKKEIVKLREKLKKSSR